MKWHVLDVAGALEAKNNLTNVFQLLNVERELFRRPR